MQRRPFLLATTTAVLAPSALLVPTWAHAASVGQAAPDFTLKDTAGKAVKLSDFKGKTVVVEWTNPGCPFVRKHYQGNMQALQKEAAGQGVVWLSINSTGNDHVDYQKPAKLAAWMGEQGASPSATLMDEDGRVGRLFGAKTTPHMYIVSAQGALVYAGGIDSIPSSRVVDIEKATNYVRQGLGELKAGKAISQASTQPYGCTVKYKSAA